MAKVRYVNFHPDEWIAGTHLLDNAERGLYITACALMYSHGGPIKVAHLREVCHDHGNAFNRQLKRLLSLGKLIRIGRRITNKRVENELDLAGKRSENARKNGAQSNKNKGLKNPEVVTKNQEPEERSSLTGKDLSIRGSIEPTTASSPPMGEAVGLMERGERLIGNRLIVYQQITAVGADKVTRALDAIERKPPHNPVAYFRRCCQGPAAVVIKEQPMSREEMERHAAERREAARLECLREAGLCADD